MFFVRLCSTLSMFFVRLCSTLSMFFVRLCVTSAISFVRFCLTSSMLFVIAAWAVAFSDRVHSNRTTNHTKASSTPTSAAFTPSTSRARTVIVLNYTPSPVRRPPATYARVPSPPPRKSVMAASARMVTCSTTQTMLTATVAPRYSAGRNRDP